MGHWFKFFDTAICCSNKDRANLFTLEEPQWRPNVQNMLMFLTLKTLHWHFHRLNLYKKWIMSEAETLPIKMILPPDGRQTRIDFFDESGLRKSSPEWWQSLASLFRHEQKEHGPDLEFFSQQLEKEGYSEKSRKSYLFMMKRFFEYFEETKPSEITMGEIEDYNFEFFVSGRYSRSYQLQFINAIKLFYSHTEGIELNLKQLRKTGIFRKKS